MDLCFSSIQEMLESILIEKINSIPELCGKPSSISVVTTLFDKACEVIFCNKMLGVRFDETLIIASGSRFQKATHDEDYPEELRKHYRILDKEWNPIEIIVKTEKEIKSLSRKNLFFIRPDGGECGNAQIIQYFIKKTRAPRIVIALSVRLSEEGKKEIDNAIETIGESIEDTSKFKIKSGGIEYYGFCAKF